MVNKLTDTVAKIVVSGIAFLTKENFRELCKRSRFLSRALWLELVLNVACVGTSEHVKCTVEMGINENCGSQ